MKKGRLSPFLVLALAAGLLAGCAGSGTSSGQEGSSGSNTDSVVIAMSPASEPEAGFDPAYG